MVPKNCPGLEPSHAADEARLAALGVGLGLALGLRPWVVSPARVSTVRQSSNCSSGSEMSGGHCYVPMAGRLGVPRSHMRSSSEPVSDLRSEGSLGMDQSSSSMA